MSGLRLLLVEDSPDDAELLLRELRRGGEDPLAERVDTADAFRAALERPWDVVISDYRMPRFSGLEALEILKARGLDLPFILVSGFMGEDLAVQAMKAGAHDYVMKDRLARLVPAVRRELADAEVRRKRREAEEALRTAYAELERRVRERTAELSQANAHLREELAERRRLEGERQRLFVQLLRGQKLQAIGQLAAGIAHEINNPVGWILSNLGTLEKYATTLERFLADAAALGRGMAGSRAARYEEKLSALREEADLDYILKDFADAVRDSRDGAVRIRDIVASLKGFSRAGDPEPEEADLRDILESAVRLCAGEIKHKARVVRRFEPLPKVRCRPREIEQVFINLIMNAAQAIPVRGEIVVSTAREDGQAVVRIRDSGTGIAPEHQRRLFEPFFTTKPVGKGTGLGLHVAFKIVKAHGGRIFASSRPGEGTEMTVRLPIGTSEAPAPAPPAPARTAAGRRGRPLVVLVDDDPAALRGLRRALAGEPIRVLSTVDPQRALTWVAARDVRVVVSDQRMPGMSGTDLLGEVARRSPVTRRLLVTAWPESLEVAQARGTTAEAVIPKPWNDEEFSRAVRACVGLSSAEDA